MNQKAELIEEIVSKLFMGDKDSAKTIIKTKYPFIYYETKKRSYTNSQMMQVFIKDGFIDRYSGDRLVNPGILRILSLYFPEEFPYQSHWKMSECHYAYWELVPTVDHVIPIARGGADDILNWVTTSMLNNSIKSNWTLEQMRWSLYAPGNIYDWDGLTKQFIDLINANEELLKDSYIKKWYRISKDSGIAGELYS